MGIVNNTVTDSIRDSWITDNFMPAGYRKLGYKDRRFTSVSILKDFQQGETILCIKRFETKIVYNNDYLGTLPYFFLGPPIFPMKTGKCLSQFLNIGYKYTLWLQGQCKASKIIRKACL